MTDLLTLAALRGLVDFSDPQLAPDSRSLAYVRTVRDYVHDRNVSSLVVSSIDGRTVRTIDAGPAVFAPRWSPDGSRLAYLKATAGPPQIVVRRRTGSARTVTAAPNGVEHFAWSPDGTRLAYVTEDAAPARGNDDLFEVRNVGFRTVAPPQPSHLWLVASTGGTATRLTHGTWSVYEGVAPFAGGAADPSWSPDGRTLLIARAPDARNADSDRTAIAAVDVATGAVRDLGTLRQNVYAPAFAPDGASYVYTRPHGPGPISITQAVVAPRSGGDGSVRGAQLDRDLMSVRWNGNALLGTIDDGLRTSLITVASDGTVQPVDTGALSVQEADARGGTIAFTGSAYGVPPEVYVRRNGSVRAITAANAALGRLRGGRAERVTWTAPDGTASEGILVHPVDEVAGRRYPLFIWHHGGPESASLLSYTQNNPENYPVGQLVSAHGWFAFLPNYRGSNDLGTAHEHAIYRDPVAGPMSDTMAGLAEVERRAAIDTSRECVGGRSYGGTMTAWIISHDTRFRCAAIVDGAMDWRAEYDLSASGNMAFARDSLGGSPWHGDAVDLYRDASPITYAAQVRTPSLIVTGLEDDVVPWTISWEFYHALEDNGVDVHLIGIPTAHHHPNDPVRLEAYQRTLYDYLSRWLR